MVTLTTRPAPGPRVRAVAAALAVLAALVDKVSFAPVAGDAVRLRIPATRFGGQDPKLAELTVSG